jgi:hypothetical protein
LIDVKALEFRFIGAESYYAAVELLEDVQQLGFVGSGNLKWAPVTPVNEDYL